MINVTTFDKVQKYLFSEKSLSKNYLNEDEMAVLDRYAQTFTYWYNNPAMTDRQIQNYIVRNFGVTTKTAIMDVPYIKALLGNVKMANKDYHRYIVVEMCKEAYQLAKNRNPPDVKGMVMAANSLGKYTRIDQDDIDNIPWDKILPPNFEPTDNLSVLELSTDPDFEQRMRKLKTKYMREIEDITPETIDGDD